VPKRARVPWRVELGARLRYERESRGWYRSQLAGRLRSVPGEDHPPEVRQLVDMIAQRERGDHAPGPDYRRRYSHVFGRWHCSTRRWTSPTSTGMARADELGHLATASASKTRRLDIEV
jgi:transcriptional regulator with XRE-family HTH domain